MINKRPRYNRPKDNANNRRVLNQLARFLPGRLAEVFTTDTDCDYDGEIYIDGPLTLIAEVKGRTGSGNRFSTWHIAKSKLDACMVHARALNVPLYLLFSWDNDVYYWVVKDIDKLEVREGGRWDRGDFYDVEPMVHIPRSFFTKI